MCAIYFGANHKGNAEDFRTGLIRRYWKYQRESYPDIENYFDRASASDRRPPVFLPNKADHNVITKPDAEAGEVGKLLSFMPASERHKWFRSMNSSQALAASLFGNLAVYGALNCLSELQDDAGRELTAGADLTSSNFSMEHKVDYLGEQRQTSIDVYVGGNYRLALECKFAEVEVGACSRPHLRLNDSNYERDFCNGTYTPQRGRKESCSLTEVGVKYWRYVPQLFKWPNEMSSTACPLYKTYQLVRNVLAVAVTPGGAVSAHSGHAILIYDERNPAFGSNGKGLEAYTQTQRALHEPGMLRKCSWQRIVQHIRSRKLLPWLTERLALKYGL